MRSLYKGIAYPEAGSSPLDMTCVLPILSLLNNTSSSGDVLYPVNYNQGFDETIGTSSGLEVSAASPDWEALTVLLLKSYADRTTENGVLLEAVKLLLADLELVRRENQALAIELQLQKLQNKKMNEKRYYDTTNTGHLYEQNKGWQQHLRVCNAFAPILPDDEGEVPVKDTFPSNETPTLSNGTIAKCMQSDGVQDSYSPEGSRNRDMEFLKDHLPIGRCRAKSDEYYICDSDLTYGISDRLDIRWNIGNASVMKKEKKLVHIVSPRFETRGPLGDCWVMLICNEPSADQSPEDTSFGIALSFSEQIPVKFYLFVGRMRRGPFCHDFKASPWKRFPFFTKFGDAINEDSDMISIGVDVCARGEVKYIPSSPKSCCGHLSVHSPPIFPLLMSSKQMSGVAEPEKRKKRRSRGKRGSRRLHTTGFISSEEYHHSAEDEA